MPTSKPTRLTRREFIKLSSAILLCVVLAACGVAPTPTATLAPTNTPLPTNTLAPTSTPTITPTVTIAPSKTPEPTATLQPTPESKVGTIIFERKNELTSSDIGTIEKNSGNDTLGSISRILDKDKKIVGVDISVVPKKIYENDGKYYCDCVLDRSLSIHSIEIGSILTSDAFGTDKKLPGEFGTCLSLKTG